ncbi:MAG: hypothetical protein ACK5BR_03240 [Bacteroidota bacterium]|jgi:hypothetical protein
MKCPTCKNPIEGRSAVCEWCGVSLEPQLNNSVRNNSSNLASGKAIKYTSYFVLSVLILVFYINNKTLGAYSYFIFIFSIITIELYTYLKNRFSK